MLVAVVLLYCLGPLNSVALRVTAIQNYYDSLLYRNDFFPPAKSPVELLHTRRMRVFSPPALWNFHEWILNINNHNARLRLKTREYWEFWIFILEQRVFS